MVSVALSGLFKNGMRLLVRKRVCIRLWVGNLKAVKICLNLEELQISQQRSFCFSGIYANRKGV